MAAATGSYQVVSPVNQSITAGTSLAAPLTDLRGKTIAAMRHTFRADEVFPMLEKLFRQHYGDIRFISNFDMPDSKAATAKEQAELTQVLKDKGCDILLTGMGA